MFENIEDLRCFLITLNEYFTVEIMYFLIGHWQKLKVNQFVP